MEYFRPQHLRTAIRLIRHRKGKAKLIAGGTNVIPDLRAGAIDPSALIDLSHLKSLSYIKEERRKIRVGALTTISELATSNVIQKNASILSQACHQLGNPLVRNRATLAGNLADASPAADTAVPLLALEAFVLIRGGKEKQVPIDQFFIGPNRTVLKPEEIIKEIYFSRPNSNIRMAYAKLGLRNSMAISVVSLALSMEMEKGFCKKARIGLGAVAPTPIRAYRTEEMLENKEIDERLLETCCETIAKEIHPISDIRASAGYRREATSVLLKRLIRQVALE